MSPDRGGVFAYHDIGPKERAPRLALVADLHGNELNGMFILSRLAAYLRGIRLSDRRGLRLRERIVIVPTINTLEPVDAHKAPQRADTSRRRLLWVEATDAVLALTRTAYYRVDIHQANLDIEEMPQVRLYAPSDDERATACLFGLPAVIERPMEHGAVSGLAHAWRQQGGENFSIYAGQSGSVQTRHCEIVFKALVAFLDRTGIVTGLKSTGADELGYFGLRQICVVSAEQPGIFSSPLEVGRWVRAGEELGQIYDSFSGGVRLRVIAPTTGLLASLRRQPLLGKGELLARILIPEAAKRRPATGTLHERRAVSRP
ncbi:MAG TPA: hypothetical protein DIC59_15210 [Candidatus Competibacteraceae bacterium]|nr:hypothetical protein [Candidatus Competibacteraceae bacterium]